VDLVDALRVADWKPPAEFDDWEEYEAALDLLILELGQALAAAWTAAQFERALDGMSTEHAAGGGSKGDGDDEATTEEPPVVADDDIMGQLLAQRGMGLVRRRSRHTAISPSHRAAGWRITSSHLFSALELHFSDSFKTVCPTRVVRCRRA